MRIFCLAIISLLMTIPIHSQQIVNIGPTTTFSNDVVFDGYYNYSKYQYIYTASEVGTAGVLQKIGVYVGDFYLGETAGNLENISVRIGHTEVDHFSSSSYSLDANNIVFQGSMGFKLGWNWIILSNDFYFNGTDNLIIEFRSEDGDWMGNPIPEFAFEQLPFGEEHYKKVGDHSDYSNPPTPYRGKNRASVALDFSSTFEPLNITGNPNHQKCGSAGSGSVYAAVTGGTPPYSYLWSDGQTTPSATNLGPGEITVTVTDAGEYQQSAQKTFLVSNILTWDYLQGLDNNINTLTKTAGIGQANSWASSENELVGDGELSFVVNDLNDYFIIGLSAQAHTEGNYYAIDYGWEQYGGYMYYDDYYSYLIPQIGDRFKIKREGDYVFFYHNDLQVGPSKYVPSGTSLFVEASIYENGDAIEDIYVNFCMPLRVSYETVPASLGDANGDVYVTVTGGIGTISYQWAHGKTTKDLLSVNTGKYNCVITDGANEQIEINPEVRSRVTWNEKINLMDFGANLKRTNLEGETKSVANSINVLKENGELSFKINDSQQQYIIGLTEKYRIESNYGSIDYYDFNYAIEIDNGYLWIIENGSFIGYLPIANNDIIEIKKKGLEITYYINKEKVNYTSYLNFEKEFFVSASIETLYAEIINLSVTFQGLVQNNTSYFLLNNRLNNHYYDIRNKDLNFIYEEEYNLNANAILNYRIYNDDQELILTGDDYPVSIQKGKNKITLECLSDLLNTTTGFYILEIENGKGDKQYLKFRMNVNFSCPNGDLNSGTE